MSRERLVKLYIWTIVAVGGALCLLSVSRVKTSSIDLGLILLAFITIVVSSRLSIQIPRVTSHITVSDTFIFLLIFLYGGEIATLVAAAEALCSASRISRKARTLLFNASLLATSTFLTAGVRQLCLGQAGASRGINFSAENMVALCLMVFVQYIFNSGLASLYEALKSNQSVWYTWHKFYFWTSISYVAGASAAFITAYLITSFGFYMILVTTPIIGIIFFTYQIYLKNIQTAEAQAEQARQHVEELRHYIEEQERIREQFTQVEKMSALGVLASGVAHDFNNTLAAILGRAELMMRHTDDPKMLRGLDIIVKSAQGGAKTVKRIQDFARQRRDHNFAPIAVDQLLLDVSEITRPRWKDSAEAKNVYISLELENRSGVSLMGEVSELRDVLVNMIFNAVDAMPSGGKLILKSEVVNNAVVISVSDTGQGMTPEVRSHIFDPFFTTKGVEGMGLGLAVSYGVIRRHNGTIDVESEVGRGTTFQITLPLTKGGGKIKDAQAGLRKEASEARKDMPKILVVDDEERVRELMGEILEDQGHEVTLAASGQEGLRLFEAEEFDAVFTDLGMPGMSGWDLARAIRERNQRLPLAIITGWGDAVSSDEKESAGVSWILTKPFSMAQIEEVTREVSKLRGEAELCPPFVTA